MKEFNDLTRRDQEKFLMLPIITELKQLGGQATTNDIKRGLVEGDYGIPETELTNTKVGKNGSYRPFDFPFNFAITNLVMAEYLERPQRGLVVLTPKGRSFKGDKKQLVDDVYEITLPKWKERSKKDHHKDNDQDESVSDIQFDVEDPWRTKLLDALNNLTPSKFEFFCRALVKKMNVDIDETIGVKQSGDGGLDGFGYMMADDFRTSSVAIQAKRWSKNLVSSPEIDKFRGAMDKYRADYGIFITTSSFSKEAVKAARTGTKIITLIDGERLVDLVAKYKLYVTPVVTYELGEFFTEDNQIETTELT